MNGEDLKKARDKFELTQDELSKLAGVTRKTINTYENSNEIPISKQKLFLAIFDDLGNKMLPRVLPQEIINNPKMEIMSSGVPYYDVDFAGGWNSEELFANHLPTFSITSPDFKKAEFACNLIGNSISRRIPHRAIIGLKEIHDWEIYFPTNELYAVLMKNELCTVKVVKNGEG